MSKVRLGFVYTFGALVVLVVVILLVRSDLDRRASREIITREPMNTSREYITRTPTSASGEAITRKPISASDCGPLFDGPVDTNATGRICDYSTYTDALKRVIDSYTSNKSILPDSDMLQSSNISDVFIAVRSTCKLHPPRLSLQMITWMQKMIPSQVYNLRS